MKARWYDLGALPYDLLTRQAIWAEHVGHLLRAVPCQREPSRVVDLGCGPGVSAEVLAKTFPGAQIVALDLSLGMLRRAQRRLLHEPRIALAAADACRLPLPDASVDLLIGHSLLYLVSDPRQALLEARRVLRPGGGLGFLEPSATGSLRRAARELPLGDLARELSRRPLDALRFGASMVAWRWFSDAVGRIEPHQAEAWLREAGLERVTAQPTLKGLGLMCLGSRPAQD